MGLAGAERSAAARIRQHRYRRLLALADLSAALVALSICFPVLGRGDVVSGALIAGLPVAVVIAKLLGLYDRDELVMRKSTLDEAPKLFQLATLLTLGVFIGEAPLRLGEIGGDQALALWVVLFAALLTARFWARELAFRITEPERCLLIGAKVTCKRVRGKIESPAIGARVVVQAMPERIDEESVPLSFLSELVAENDVQRVVIAPRSTDHSDVLDVVRAVKSLGVNVSVYPRMLDVVGSSVVVDELGGLRLLGVRRFGLTRSSALIKRSLDVFGSGLGLAFLAPLLFLIAAAVRLDSRGPVLFRQPRIGRNGTPFQMLKFRTMVDGADRRTAGLSKTADDPRITRVGRLLRRTYLDELPQLLNVLRGDMSLVGPRPLVAEDDALIVGWDRRRLHLTPGMTGLWQVIGQTRPPLEEMVKLDYLYVATWSLWGDVKILLWTIASVLRRRGL